MRAIDGAADIIGRYVHPDFAESAARDLEAEGYLTSAPTIIRTVEELEALDPDSIVLDCTGHLMTNRNRLPGVVVAPAAQARAARKALEEA